MQNFIVSPENLCTDVDNPAEIVVHDFNENNLSIINVNIRSLKKNYSKLTAFLSKIKFKAKIIVVTETWLRPEHDNLLKIKGYHQISVNRQHKPGKRVRSGGGLRIYHCESLNVDSIPHLSGIFPTHESLFVTVSSRNSGKIIIGAIYRPPQNCINAFNSYLQANLLNDQFDHAIGYIITGDMNINFTEDVSRLDKASFDYFNYFVQFNFKFLIDKPTRVSNYKSSIIDHTWSNFDKAVQSFVINEPVSDHSMTLSVFEIKPASILFTKNFRDFSKKNIDKYLSKKAGIFETLKPSGEFDVNNVIDKLYDKFPKNVNKYFPIKTKQESEKRYRSLWLSKPIIKCINKRHSFFKLLKQGVIEKSFYVEYSKLVDRLIDISREPYFITCFNKCVKNSKALWRNIKKLKGEKVKPSIFNIDNNGLTITDRKSVNGIFNNFLSTIQKSCSVNCLLQRHLTWYRCISVQFI